MFTRVIDSIEIELADKCNARCPQCPRYDNNHRLVKGLNKNEITLDTFKQIDVIKNLKHLDFKGTTGDPIIAKDLIAIIDYVRQINKHCSIGIATNGSLHDNEYWTRLAELDCDIVFGIDGLSGVHEMYRIGTDFHKVLQNAKTFIQAGGYAEWQMLIFEHNEHQIEDCEKMASQIGFQKFNTMHSDRFAYVDSTDVGTYTLRPTKQSYNNAETKIKDKTAVKKVSCMSLNNNSIFIYADGSVWPCCMLGGITAWGKHTPHSQVEISMINKHIGTIGNIHQNNLTDILNSDDWNRWQWVTQGKMPTCRLYCGV